MTLGKNRIAVLKSAFEERSGLSWSDVVKQSTEIVLFGSWAVQRETEKSDIDLLCVDFSRRLKRPKIDMLSFPSAFLKSETWLTSELAVHISQYGIWLKGTGRWRQDVRITNDTIIKKKEQILIRSVRLALTLKSSSRNNRERELQKLRRDLQRLGHLLAGAASPPAAILDDEWIAKISSQKDVAKLLFETTNNILENATSLGFEFPRR